MVTDENSRDCNHTFTRLRRLDTGRLKRVGVVSYFGFYALIALGVRRGINELFRWLPDGLRPALLAPIDAVLGLPTSIAWSLASFVVSLTVVAIVAGVSVYRLQPEDDPDSNAGRNDPFVEPNVVDPDRRTDAENDSNAVNTSHDD